MEHKFKVITNVYETYDYSLFKTINGNRDINKAHVERIKKSFLKRQLITCIIVNERFYVIDGQHRLEVAKELKMPIYFIIVPGYGLDEVKTLNTNTKNWSSEDFLNAYCDLNNHNYVMLKAFLGDFPDFSTRNAILIVSGKLSTYGPRSQFTDNHGNVIHTYDFKNGTFQIEDINTSYEIAYKIMDFKPFYSGFNRSLFIIAITTAFRSKNYNHEQMIKRLKSNPNSIYHCSTSGQYLDIIEEIYNYRSREKVSLKYNN